MSRQSREAKLLAAIGRLRPEHATIPNIARLAGVNAAFAAMSLADMTQAGTVVREPLPDSDLCTYHRPEA